MKLIDTITTPTLDGIIIELQKLGYFAWLTPETATTLNIEYYMGHSGDKTSSPLFNKISEKMLNPIEEIAKIVGIKFRNKWNKIFEAYYNTEYKPLENYAMNQVETPNITKTNEQTIADKEDSTLKANALSKSGTDLQTEQSSNAEANIYGFNSVTPVPTNDNTGQSVSNVKGDKEKNTSESISENIDSMIKNQKVNGKEIESGTRTLTRNGNIGVTTSQQMLESEIALRQYNFIEQIFEDIDSVLALKIYL